MIIIGTLSFLLFSLIFPGEDTMKAMLKIFYESVMSGLFNPINTDSPGWILWVTMIFSIFLYYIIAFSGINIGSKVIPTIESDGIDIVLTHSSYSARKLYLWNYLGAILSLVIIILPLYGIVSIFSLIQSSTFILDEIALSFLIFLASGIFFLTLSSVGSILRFSKSFGKILGFGYLILCFLIDLLSGSPEYADYADLSINHYLNPTQIIFFGCSNDNFFDIWGPFLVILGISAGLFLIGLWRVKFPDYIERVKELNPNGSKLSFNPLGKILEPDSIIAKKLPLFINQLRRNMKVVILLLFLIALQLFGLFKGLPSPDELMLQLEQSNTPIFAAFIQNHNIPASLLGFVILKFYSGLWIYFGIPIALITASIPNKDVRTSTHDILFANDISPIRLILARTFSMILSFTILIWALFFISRGIQSSVVDFDLSFKLQAQVFTVLWIHYIGMGIFLIGIALIPLVSKGKNLAMFVFIFFILMAIIPFLNQNLEFLKYTSYLNYYDPVGILIGEVEFSKALLTSLLMLFGSSAFTYILVKFKYSKTDLR
jgi:hypothetical protein